MGSCGSSQKIIKQIKAQDEQLEHLISLNTKLTDYLNSNNSKFENSTETSPLFQQYKVQIDDRFAQLEKQISEIYFKLRKLNIFENEIPEFTEIVEADINSFEQALNQSDFKENDHNINNTEQQEKNEKITSNNNIKKPPRQSHQQQCASKNTIKRLRQKMISSTSNQLKDALSQQKNKHKSNKSHQKMNLNSEDFIKLTKNSKLSDQMKEELNEQKNKKDFEKKRSKESQKI